MANGARRLLSRCFGFRFGFHSPFAIPILMLNFLRVCAQTHSFQRRGFPVNLPVTGCGNPPEGNNRLQLGIGFVTCDT